MRRRTPTLPAYPPRRSLHPTTRRATRMVSSSTTTATFSRSLPFVQPSPWDGLAGGVGCPELGFRLPVQRARRRRLGVPRPERVGAVDDAGLPHPQRRGDRPVDVDDQPRPDDLHVVARVRQATVLGLPCSARRSCCRSPAAVDGYPLTFRVMPPWMMHVEMKGGVRVYRLGGESGPDVTDEILHIRYKSTTDGAHGVGPLEAAGGRMLTAGVLAQYVREIAATGGVPDVHARDRPAVDRPTKAQDLLDAWMTSRAANLGAPPVLDSGVDAEDAHGDVAEGHGDVGDRRSSPRPASPCCSGCRRSWSALPSGGSR